MTSKEIVYTMLRPRRWVHGSDLEMTAGAGALRRLRELRDDFNIKKRRTSNGTFEYRLVGPR